MDYLAPISIFVYKRPDHTLRLLESLEKNNEFYSSPLFFFCDGPRSDDENIAVSSVRDLVRNWDHPNKTIIERDKNMGLANSVIDGVTQLCKHFGRVIVIEDDLIVAPFFLDYLNKALFLYKEEPRVMQISAHMFPVDFLSETDAVMLPFTTSWGWATWSRSWELFDSSMRGFEVLKKDKALQKRFDLDGAYPYYAMLKNQYKGLINSWAICWYKSVFLSKGLVLFPKYSLIKHDGYGNAATHAKYRDYFPMASLWPNKILRFPDVSLDETSYYQVSFFLKSERSILKRIISRLWFCKK